MPHVDADTLALIALGEPAASRADLAHLDGCEGCAASLAELSRVTRLGRDSLADGPLSAPRPEVWAGVAAELGLAADLRPPARLGSTADLGPPTRFGPAAEPGPLAEPGPAAEPGLLAEPWPPARPRRRLVPLLAAAAAAVLLVAAGVAGWQLLRPVPPEILATAALDAFPDWPGASGRAEVERLPDGSRVVRLSIAAPDRPGDYREAWLITQDATALVSLGVVDSSTTVLAIPDDIDLARYDLVDVSAESFDGDPAHSGDSIVRGRLGG